jgi:hypothetical protein
LTKISLAEKMSSMSGGLKQCADFTSVVIRPMGKHPQNRYRRLVLVGPDEQQPQRVSAASLWGGASHPTAKPTGAQLKALRMAVMPTFSRGIWLEAVSAMTKFVRNYFSTPRKQQRGAVVLSFRRHGFPRPWVEKVEETGYVTKKANAGVCWSSDQTPREGGRA